MGTSSYYNPSQVLSPYAPTASYALQHTLNFMLPNRSENETDLKIRQAPKTSDNLPENING